MADQDTWRHLRVDTRSFKQPLVELRREDAVWDLLGIGPSVIETSGTNSKYLDMQTGNSISRIDDTNTTQ